MGFLKQDLATVDLVEGVMPWLPPTAEEVLRCDAAAFAAGGLDRARVLHETFLLKAALGLQYGLGLLETLGMRAEGVEQFQAFYVRRLAEGLLQGFPNEREVALGLLASRLKAYDQALHSGHPEDPHLAVADAYTRFCGAPDERSLVGLCLDLCKAMHQRFIQELKDLGSQASPQPEPPIA